MTMKNPPHPGAIVKYDCLEPLGLTVTKAADWLGISHNTLSELVNGCAAFPPRWRSGLKKPAGAPPICESASRPITISRRRRSGRAKSS